MELVEMRLKLKPRVNKERVKELLGGSADKRFLHLQKLLISDLDKADFRTISLGLYMRLGGWSHTAGSYVNAMIEVRALCKVMFGYELPEKIGNYYLKGYRYRAGKGLLEVGPVIKSFHEKQLGKS